MNFLAKERLALDKFLDDNLTFSWSWLLSTYMIFAFYSSYFLLIKSHLSIGYTLGSMPVALVLAAMYIVSLNITDVNNQYYDHLSNIDVLASSLLLLISFAPAIGLACTKISFVAHLLKKISSIYVGLIVTTSVVIGFFTCAILLDFLAGSMKKINHNRIDRLHIFTLSNGLIMISGFLALGSCVLPLVKNLISKILIVAVMIYTIAWTSLHVVNSASMTNCWTMKKFEFEQTLKIMKFTHEKNV